MFPRLRHCTLQGTPPHFYNTNSSGRSCVRTLLAPPLLAPPLKGVMAAGSNVPLKAFRRHSAELIEAIQDPEYLVWQLYANDVVTAAAVDQVSVREHVASYLIYRAIPCYIYTPPLKARDKRLSKVLI